MTTKRKTTKRKQVKSRTDIIDASIECSFCGSRIEGYAGNEQMWELVSRLMVMAVAGMVCDNCESDPDCEI